MSHMYICFFKTDDLNQVYIIVLKLRTIFNSHENPTCWLLNEGTGHRALTRAYLIIVTDAADAVSVNFYRFNAKNWHFRQILYNKMCIIIYFLPISSHKMCEASAEHILWH